MQTKREREREREREKKKKKIFRSIKEARPENWKNSKATNGNGDF